MNPRKLNQLIFITLLAAIAYKLPLFLDLTKAQRINLVIFLVAALLWITEVVPLFVTALIILFLEAVWLQPNAPGTSLSTYLSPFFSSVILLFLGGFVLAKALETYKLDEIFAKKILQRTGTKPSSVLFGFMIVTAFLSMWMSNTAITALMIAVALPLVRKVDDKNFTKALLIGIAFSANIGGMGTPIGTPPNAIAMEALKSQGIHLSFTKWLMLALPITLLLLLVTWGILNIFFRSKSQKIEIKFEEQPVIETKGKVILITSVITALLWLTTEIHKIPSSIVALIPIIVYFSSGILERKHFNSLSWDVLILMGGGLSLGKAFNVTGLSKWLVHSIGFEHMSQYAVLAVLVIITIVLTNFMSNTSTAALIIPLALSLEANPVAFAISIALSASASMLLPVSTPPNAIAYSSGRLRVKDMFITGLVITTLMGILILTFQYFWVHLIGM